MEPDYKNDFRPVLDQDPPRFIDRVDTPWSDVPDLPAYNQRQYRRLERSLRQLTQNDSSNPSSQGVLVLGEAGTGKTHLLMRVASKLSHRNHILFVRKPNNEETVAHHVWANIVSSLTHRVPTSGTERSQLDDLLAHVFSRVLISNFKEDLAKGVQVDQRQRWITDLEGNPFNIFSMLGSGERRNKNLGSLRNRTLRYLLLHYPGVDQRIAHVLITYCFTVQEDRKRMLLTWLTGQDIDESDAEFLGLPPSWTDSEEGVTDTSLQQQREEQSLRAIRTVGILSTLYQPLILAFDQLEGLRGEERLTQRWGDVIREIFTMTPNMLVVTCIFPSLWETWFKPNLEQSVVQRIAQSQFELEAFQPSHAQTMLQTHMRGSFDKHRLPTEIYPFTGDDIPVLCEHASSPRSFVQAVRNAFEQWLDDGDDVADLTGSFGKEEVVTQEAVDRVLTQELNRHRDRQENVYHSEIPIEEDFFGRVRSIVKAMITSRGLDCSIDKARFGTRVMPPNLLVRDGKGASVCIAVMYRMGNAFAARLKNLKTVHENGSFDKLIVVRDGRCGALGATTRRYVSELPGLGIEYVNAGIDEIPLLHAIYDTLVSIEEHDVVVGRQEVSKQQFISYLESLDSKKQSTLLRALAKTGSPFSRQTGPAPEPNTTAADIGATRDASAQKSKPLRKPEYVSWDELRRMRGVPLPPVDRNPIVEEPLGPTPPAKQKNLVPPRVVAESEVAGNHRFELPPAKLLEETSHIDGLDLDVIIGADSFDVAHRAVMGRLVDEDETLGISLSKPQCLAILGYMGSGKSYALGVIIENALLRAKSLVSQQKPLSVLAFNYRRNPESRFEYGGYRLPNANAGEVQTLEQQYQAIPEGVEKVNVLAYEPEIARRQGDYQGLSQFPIQFRSDELSAEHWEILMKPPRTQSEYMDVVRNVIQRLYYESKLDLKNLENAILNDQRLTESQRRRAINRFEFAKQWINDERNYEWSDLLASGALTVVDLRMQTSTSDEALKLCLIITDLARRTKNGVNKLIVFDEAHEYVDSKHLIDELENAVTQIRHDGLSFVLASQFPDRIPEKIFKYLLTRFLFKLPHAAGVKYLHKMSSSLRWLTEQRLSNLDLEKGVCYVQTDDDTSSPRLRQPRLLSVRPRLSQHGGATQRQGSLIWRSPSDVSGDWTQEIGNEEFLSFSPGTDEVVDSGNSVPQQKAVEHRGSADPGIAATAIHRELNEDPAAVETAVKPGQHSEEEVATTSEEALTQSQSTESEEDSDSIIAGDPVTERRFKIAFGDTGHSYEKLISPYLANAEEVVVEDAYIRRPHQVHNLVRLSEAIVKHSSVSRIKLVTKFETPGEGRDVLPMLEDLKQSLALWGVELEISFSPTLHDREIRIDNGWIIKIGRGLDFFQPTESRFDIGTNDFTLRKCRETSVDIYKE